MSWLSKLLGSNEEPTRRAAIIEVSDKTFQTQVIRRSYKQPVLVDFWAAWCGPCRRLGPVLERLAEEPDGEWMLAKLNTEDNRRVATEYHIRSIPNVKAFRNGQVVDEFTGALPGALVRRFIDKVVEADPPPPQVRGSENAEKRLQQVKRHLRKGRGFEAFVLLKQFPDGVPSDEAEALRPFAEFLFNMENGDALTALDELDAHYEAAAAALRRGNFEKGLASLSRALEAGEDMDKPYTTAIIEAVLALLGEEHEVTRSYRQKPAG